MRQECKRGRGKIFLSEQQGRYKKGREGKGMNERERGERIHNGTFTVQETSRDYPSYLEDDVGGDDYDDDGHHVKVDSSTLAWACDNHHRLRGGLGWGFARSNDMPVEQADDDSTGRGSVAGVSNDCDGKIEKREDKAGHGT